MNKNLSIIIPCYNEESGIGSTLEDLIPHCRQRQWQIIVVNDASTDNTPEILKKFEKEVIIIHHSVNKGYGASLKSGILQAQTEYVAFFDADGQHTSQDLIKLAEGISGRDMVVGERGKDSHREWIRKPGKWLLSVVANILTGRKIPDLNSGLRIVKTNIIKELLHLFPDGFSFSTTSTIAFMKLGYNVGYLPIKVNKRIGKSSVRQFKHGSSTLLLIIRLIMLFNPLRIFIPTSIFFIVVGGIYEIMYGICVLWPDVKLIPAAFFLFITGILVFLFGLIADQISAIRLHHTLK